MPASRSYRKLATGAALAVRDLRCRIRDTQIRTKLMGSFTVVIGLITVFIFLYVPARLERQAVHDLAEHAHRIAEMAAYSASESVFMNDAQAVAEAVEVAEQNPDLAYLIVLNRAGDVLASFRPNQALEADFWRFEGGTRTRGAVTAQGSVYKVQVPVLNATQEVGRLYLGLSMDALHANVDASRAAIFWVSLLIFILGGAVSLWLSALLSGPLREITQTAEHIAEGGDLSERATIYARDEVGQLAQSFNLMVERLDRANRDLAMLNENLEAQKSDLLRAKEEAEEMSRLKSAFLANMSHEIRTPLSGMIGFAQILAEEVGEDHQEFTQLIEESAHRLLGTLEGVLNLASLEAGHIRLKPNTYDVGTEVGLALESLRGPAAAKGLRLVLDVEAEDTEATLDRWALSQIVHHLVDNAIKFTETGTVHVRVTANADTIYLEIQDTGVGISEHFLPYLFSEFQQESSGTDRSHEGTGIGLTITKRLVDMLQGHISVSSQRGRGSTFKVLLPRTPAATTPKRPGVWRGAQVEDRS